MHFKSQWVGCREMGWDVGVSNTRLGGSCSAFPEGNMAHQVTSGFRSSQASTQTRLPMNCRPIIPLPPGWKKNGLCVQEVVEASFLDPFPFPFRARLMGTTHRDSGSRVKPMGVGWGWGGNMSGSK